MNSQKILSVSTLNRRGANFFPMNLAGIRTSHVERGSRESRAGNDCWGHFYVTPALRDSFLKIG